VKFLLLLSTGLIEGMTAMTNDLLKALSSALDQFDGGFVLASPAGEILHANRAAREMMSVGWPFRSKGGILQAGSQKTTHALLNGLRQMADLAAQSPSRDACLDVCLADAASPGGAAIATLKPLIAAKLGGSGCAVALFVTRIMRNGDCTVSGISQCFALTAAETRTLHHLVAGDTLAEASRALALSENTVKTHLQNIFAKTRSSRQAQLIKLVSTFRPLLKAVTEGNAIASRPCRAEKDAVSI
jgi:DNA-binding CsgD family transcriptional regulator